MWQEYIYSSTGGDRPYFVYTPENYRVGTAVPLVVMLHGCGQTPVDFATGTQMNQLADQNNFIVVYPQQTNAYNRYTCWNWFESDNQTRDSGEPAIIAGIVRTMQNNTSQWTINARRIFVAGLSAGAAMSVILGATYPDIFAAIGVHSGLVYQAASNAKIAARVMQRGGPDQVEQGHAAHRAMGSFARVVPTIVFQGTSDYVVNPINGSQVVQQWIETNMLASNGSYAADFNNPSSTTTGQVPGGRSYSIYTWNNSKGSEVQVYWEVNKLGHAWSGGNSGGSYTDPQGPNASHAIYTFFMDHPKMGRVLSASDGHGGSILGNLRRKVVDLFQG